MCKSLQTNAESTFLKKLKLLKFKHMWIIGLKFEYEIFSYDYWKILKNQKIISKSLKYLNSGIRYY